MSINSILITGASTGFGYNTAETLKRAGHNVFASMRDPRDKNREHADALRKQRIDVVELDVGSDASVDRAVKEVLARSNRIDVLINNAGIASAGVTEAFTADQANVVFNTNVVGLLRATRAVLPHVVEALGLGHLALHGIFPSGRCPKPTRCRPSNRKARGTAQRQRACAGRQRR